MKKFTTIIALSFSLFASFVNPALAQKNQIDQGDNQTKTTLTARNKCFKATNNSVIIPLTLTQEQKNFLMVARFANKGDLDQYKISNSVINIMNKCLDSNQTIKGFTKERLDRNTTQYTAVRLNVTIVDNGSSEVIQGLVIATVKKYPRSPRVITVIRTA
jgi:hypothetical protein